MNRVTPSLLLRLMFLALAFWLRGSSARADDLVSDLERDVTPHSGMPCPSPESYSLTRPDPDGTPTTVGAAVFFQDIAQLSDIEQTMDADVYVVARWRDPRLADPARGEHSADCPLPEGKLWMPTLEPENLRSRQSFYAPRFTVDAKGVVTLGRRLWVKIAYPLNFQEFPFDKHQWTITVWPVFSRADEIVFHPLKQWVGKNDHLSLQGWGVGTPRAEATIAPRIGRAGEFARFDVLVELDRDWGYYAWKLGAPLTLIVLMAYGVYFIPSSLVASQVALGMTGMLTVIAYMLALGGSLPRFSYLTRADRFFLGSALLVFLGLAKAVSTAAFGIGQEPGAIHRINQWGRWLYPVAMLANLLLAVFW